MGCFCDNSEETSKEVTLSFRRSELLYDIKNCAFVEGDITPADNIHVRHQIFDIGDEGNIDRVTRILNLAYAECIEMLYPYTKEIIPDDQEPLDDTLTEPENYEISLTLPEEFSLTTIKLLKHLIHEYFVCKVLADWMSLVGRDNHHWEEKVNKIRVKLQRSLLSRRGKIKRKLQPF